MGTSGGYACPDGSLCATRIHQVFLHKTAFTGRKVECGHCLYFKHFASRLPGWVRGAVP